MKMRHLLALILAGCAVGIVLLWVGDRPSSIPVDAKNTGQPARGHLAEGRRLFGPDQRDAAWKDIAKGPAAEAAQARGPSAADDSESEPSAPSESDGVDSDLADGEQLPGFVVGGFVQDEDGLPQPDIQVLAERIEDSGEASQVIEPMEDRVRSVFSDGEGAFLFSDLEDGEYRVSLAPVVGIAPAEVTVRAGTLNANLVVVLLRDVRAYGTVTSTDGTPISDVHIIAGPTTRFSRSGSKGEYELDISWRGKDVVTSILFQHKGFQDQRTRINPADLDELIGDYRLDVSMEPLDRLTTVTGRLTDTRGSPVVGETVTILTSQMQTRYRAESDIRGNFWFDEVEPGEDYQLAIRPRSGYRNKDINPLVIPAGGLNLDIVLEPSDRGEISGWMIDPDSTPVSGFSMMLHSTVATGQSVTVISDEQGFFSAEDFPIGGAMLRTSSFPLLKVDGLRVSAEPEPPTTVVIDIGRHLLLGRVVDPLGDPVPASRITLSWEFRHGGLLNSSRRETGADQNGNFIFTDLGPDLHTMEVTAPGFSTAVRMIDLGPANNELLVELEEVEQ